MKAFDFEAVQFEGIEMCVECLPKGITVDDEDVTPIFASDERTEPVVCDVCRAEHDYMNIFPPLPPKEYFFLYELREGDDNDVSVSEFFVRAENEDAAWSTIESIIRAKLGDRIWADDGGTDRWDVMFHAKDCCKVIDAPEDCECGADHRDFFATFTFLKELDEEPTSAMSMFHSWEGEWEFDAAHAALEKFLGTLVDGRLRAKVALTAPTTPFDGEPQRVYEAIFAVKNEAQIHESDDGTAFVEYGWTRRQIGGPALDFLRFLKAEAK